MTTPALDQVRTELQHARAAGRSQLQAQLDDISAAIGTLDEREDDPKPDRLESLRVEIAKLQSDTTGETQDHLRQAHELLRAYQENQAVLDEPQEPGEGSGDADPER